ncbi:reverse transcriptase domain-containing protein [Tanacetum coccineum]
MSVQAEPILTQPTSVVRNTLGKGNEQTLENPNRPVSDAALREYCDKHYHQLLPLIAEKIHQDKTQHDKLKEVKARLNFEGCSRRSSKIQKVSQHSESRTPNLRGEHRRRRRSSCSRSTSGSPEPTPNVFSRIRRDGSESPGHRDPEREAVFTRLGRKEKGIFNRLEVPVQEKRNPFPESVTTKRRLHRERKRSRKVKIAEEDTRSQGRKNKSQALKKTTYPNHGCAKKQIPSCVSMLTGSARVWFDDLPPESVDSYDDLKKAFLANFLQQKKCIKDPVEIHHIKQRKGESTEDFVQRFKSESRHVKGALECMRISGFMHGITNPELIKRLHNNIPKSVDEMMRATIAFLTGEVAASNQARKKILPAWRQQETERKQNFDKRGDFRNQQRSKRRRDRFTLLTNSLKEILALDKGKFKAPPPMSTPVEKRNNNKFYVFYGERKGPAESSKKGRSMRKGQSFGNPNGPTCDNRQAYLVETDIESEPFEDPIETETPESPHTLASPTSLPYNTPPACHARDLEDSNTSGARSTSLDSTAPLSPDHPLTRTSPTHTPTRASFHRRTARMTVCAQPVMSLGHSTRVTEAMAFSDLAFRKRYRSSYETPLSSSSLALPVRKRYRGTLLILDIDSEEDVIGEEDTDEDEGHGLDEEGHGLDDEGRSVESDGLGLEKGRQYPRVSSGQPRLWRQLYGSGSVPEPEKPERVSALRQPTLTTWIDPEDGIAYIDVPAYPPPAPPA